MATEAKEATQSFAQRVRSRFDRLKVWSLSSLGYWIIRLLGSTMRWEVQGWYNHQAIEDSGDKIIYTFWHGQIFSATYFWRRRGIVVMTSRNRDGEYIAKVIRWFGFGAARGSSSRGSRRALAEMILETRQSDIAFTIDGPRGPRHVAKPGAVWIAAKTGFPILPVHHAPNRKWALSSWDRFQIPKPFTRALILIGNPVYVPRDVSEEDRKRYHLRLQEALDDLRHRADSYWDRKESPR